MNHQCDGFMGVQVIEGDDIHNDEKSKVTESERRCIRLGLEKSHVNDTYCIAGNLEANLLENTLMQKKARGKNRQLFKANTLKGEIRKKKQASFFVCVFRFFDRKAAASPWIHPWGQGGKEMR